MAAVTQDSRFDTVEGNHVVAYVKLSSVDNTDTYDTGLSELVSAQFNAETNAAVGYTVSTVSGQQRITFANAGTLIVRGRIVGF
jgi:hypothetical protein